MPTHCKSDGDLTVTCLCKLAPKSAARKQFLLREGRASTVLAAQERGAPPRLQQQQDAQKARAASQGGRVVPKTGRTQGLHGHHPPPKQMEPHPHATHAGRDLRPDASSSSTSGHPCPPGNNAHTLNRPTRQPRTHTQDQKGGGPKTCRARPHHHKRSNTRTRTTVAPVATGGSSTCVAHLCSGRAQCPRGNPRPHTKAS